MGLVKDSLMQGEVYQYHPIDHGFPGAQFLAGVYGVNHLEF